MVILGILQELLIHLGKNSEEKLRFKECVAEFSKKLMEVHLEQEHKHVVL